MGEHLLDDVLLLSFFIHLADVGLPARVCGGDIFPNVGDHMDIIGGNPPLECSYHDSVIFFLHSSSSELGQLFQFLEVVVGQSIPHVQVIHLLLMLLFHC